MLENLRDRFRQVNVAARNSSYYIQYSIYDYKRAIRESGIPILLLENIVADWSPGTLNTPMLTIIINYKMGYINKHYLSDKVQWKEEYKWVNDFDLVEMALDEKN